MPTEVGRCLAMGAVFLGSKTTIKNNYKMRAGMSLVFQINVCRTGDALKPHNGECFSEEIADKRNHPSLQGGFTLIELLAVLALLAIISTIVTVSISDVGAVAQDDLSHIEITEIRKALQQFRRDIGHFPDAAGSHDENDRLRLLLSCQESNPLADNYDAGCQEYKPDTKHGWNGPYFLAEHSGTEAGLFDPWGESYLLLDPQSATPSTGKVRIVSKGPNRQYDGDNANACIPNGDDIVLCVTQ